MTVPTSSLIAMGAAAAFCALLPIGILIWWRRTERVRLLPALWGALAFLLFARGLEMGLHYLCILSDNAVSRAILSSPWLYMLYGALTAGIFEECGRFCMYKTVMRRYVLAEMTILRFTFSRLMVLGPVAETTSATYDNGILLPSASSIIRSRMRSIVPRFCSAARTTRLNVRPCS